MVWLAIFCCILLYFAIFCYILLYFAILGNTLLYLAISCYILLYFGILGYTLPYLAILGYTWLSFAILCYTLLYFAIFCYILLYFAIIWGLNPPHIIFTWIQAKFLISDFPILISDFPFDIGLPLWYRTSPLISDFPPTDRVLGSCDQKGVSNHSLEWLSSAGNMTFSINHAYQSNVSVDTHYVLRFTESNTIMIHKIISFH